MSDTGQYSANPGGRESQEAKAPQEARRLWRLAKGEPEISGVFLDEKFFPLARQDNLGLGFQEGLLGAGYASRAFDLPTWQADLPHRLTRFFQDRRVRTRFTVVTRDLIRDDQGRPVPLFTVAKTDEGQGVIGELNPELTGTEELNFSLALYSLLQANTPYNRHRFDALGDFMRLGAFSLVDRHSAEMVRKHLAQRIYFEEEGCTHCLKCVTSCSEMRVGLTPEGLKVLGPAEDYCTTCRLCLSHCPHLVEVPKEDLPPEERATPAVHFTGGEATCLAGAAAQDFHQFLQQFSESGGGLEHWRLTQVYQGATLPDPDTGAEAEIRQYALEDRRPDSPLKPLLVTVLLPEYGSSRITLRLLARVGVFLTTPTGAIETEMIRGLEELGVLYHGVVDRENWGSGGSLPLVPHLHRLGRLAPERPLSDLVAAGQLDVVLSPRRQAVPEAVQAYFLKRTGNVGQILAPQLFQAFTFSHDPMFNELRDLCLEIFPRHPELLDAEAELARTYLSDIPRYTNEIHATYRTWAMASGHSACPTCAEVATLAVPLYMAMLLSLARGEVPHVTFTCETGCMSETLNKVNEVAQKVKGGRTVFGGGFAFAEAAAMSEDWAMSRGLLPHGRRYVVSQSGDGGSVIGLPAWLNALRQRAFLIKDREARVLHFINVTDTQVYSNTGGESSASSMLGMSTLTTPLGKFLLGNQRLQWQLINLAAEFPGVLAGMGHSANKLAMQEFWAEADALGRSAIRWDVTPCPETGKFFGEDPDLLARVMAHAGMLPEVVFVGRLRKRVAPINPNDRLKNWREWRSEPQPIYYWLERDPRYRPLIKKDPVTGAWEPVSPAMRFIIAQLERFRDQLNRQIDLETRLVREAEEYTDEFFAHLQEEWQKHRHVPEEFPYHFLFNELGELKAEFGPSFKRNFLEAVLGQDYVVEYAVRRDQGWAEAAQAMESAASQSGDPAFPGVQVLPPPQFFLPGCPAGLEAGFATVAEARQAEFYRVLDRLLDERALAKASQISQYILQKELARDFAARGGAFVGQPPVKALTARQEFRAALAAVGDFAIGVASLAGERGIAINRVFSHFFTAKGAWAGMAWQFGSSKRGTPVFSGTFVSPRPIERKDAILSFPFYVLTVTNYGDLKANPDVFYDNLHPQGFLVINTPKDPDEIHRELVASYDDHTRAAVAQAQSAAAGEASDKVSRFLFDSAFISLNDEQKRLATKVLALARAKVITTDMDGIMFRVSGSPKAVSNLVAVAPMIRALESLGLPVSLEADLQELTGGFPGAVVKNKKLLSWYLEAMRLRKVQPPRPQKPLLTRVTTTWRWAAPWQAWL
jgi:pyruvate/2-oxoacid:ferredoxin oxidoreductase beta subunit/ferredoxin